MKRNIITRLTCQQWEKAYKDEVSAWLLKNSPDLGAEAHNKILEEGAGDTYEVSASELKRNPDDHLLTAAHAKAVAVRDCIEARDRHDEE